MPDGSNVIRPRQRDCLEAFNGALNYGLVESWLKKCKTEHGSQCNRRPGGSAPGIRINLIDVSIRQLVHRSTVDRYIALSYVWGKGTELRLKTSDANTSQTDSVPNVNGVSKPTKGNYLPVNIPQTMEDAIRFVQRLGERYLWVDLFCIDQNNASELQGQISSMNTIFSSAYLTLINLDGEDADWGLPGVSRSLLQTAQPSVNTSEGRLTATFMYSVWHNNGTSVWDSRAWTLQERLLSSRCIIFAKNYVAMTCREEYFHDCLDVLPNVKTRMGDDYFREDGSDIKLDGHEWDFKVYDALVSAYSGRKLTVEADALNACLGSLNVISQTTGYSFSYGIPKEDIWRALVWNPHHDHVLQRRIEFPSWSWLGWSGRIEYSYWLVEMADCINHSSDAGGPRDQRPAKRHRINRFPEDEWHPDAAEIISLPSQDENSFHLTLSTTIVRFKCRLLRRHGTAHRNLRPESQQSKIAVGDHWTLLGNDGNPLRNTTGEHPVFEPTDVFFRLDPIYSDLIRRQGNVVELAFIHHCPKIRDSRETNKWCLEMVSALLIIRIADNTTIRLSSVLLDRQHWIAQRPIRATITLV